MYGANAGASNSGGTYAQPGASKFGDMDVGIEIRHAFIRKVYAIVFLQLCVTAAMSVFAMVGSTMEKPSAILAFLMLPYVYYTSLIGTFVLVCAMICGGERCRRHPTNIILLFLFTVMISVVIAVVCGLLNAVGKGDTVRNAALITAGVVAGLTAFAFQTKYDFTGTGPYLFVALWCLFIAGFVSFFFPPSNAWNMVYSGVGALIFSFFLVYDTQLVVGGSHRKYQLSIDEYVFAALNIYLDIINLFLYILQMLNSRN